MRSLHDYVPANVDIAGCYKLLRQVTDRSRRREYWKNLGFIRKG